MSVTIPEYFEDNRAYNSLIVKDSAVVTYSQKEEVLHNSVVASKNMFIYIISGSKLIHTEDKTLEFKQGSALFLKKGSYIMSEIKPPYKAMLFFYEESLMQDFLDKYSFLIEDISDEKPTNMVYIQVDTLMQSSIESMKPYIDANYNDSDIIKIKLEEIFLHILRSPEGLDLLSFLQRDTNTSSFKKLMEANLETVHTVDAMMKLSKLPPLSFRKVFRKHFNTTPKKWLDSKKFETAALLVAQTDLNIAEICNEAGFSNPSWFSKRFKEHYHCTPKEYREKTNTI